MMSNTAAGAETPLELSPERLREMLEAGEQVVVLDIRPLGERREWSIPGSLHADLYADLHSGQLEALDGLTLPSDLPIVTVCAAGNTSRIAAQALRRRGHVAYSLTGGMKSWSLAWNEAQLQTSRGTKILQLRRTGKGCLSYLFGSDGAAVVIDASLAPDVYLRIANMNGWQIRYVIDTHVHADHLSRSRLVAESTGARLCLPRQERVHFAFSALDDGDVLRIGQAELSVLATPGHTWESSSYLLDGEVVFTGDTLFLDGVGRPDLEADPTEARERSGLLHRSLQSLLALPETALVLPGHTSRPVPFDGMPVAASMADVRRRVGLLQVEKKTFVEAILGRIPPTPANHHVIVAANEAGEIPPGDVTDLEAGANRCAVS